jgi:glycosyltransferase involved in cell wall biosynthesis
LKILLSAFACSPGIGSEGGCAWKYAVGLSDDHQVWVITDASRRARIQADPLHDKPGLKFVYYRPTPLGRVDLTSRTALPIYEAWQMGVWRVARELDRQHDFDFIWHLTYGSFRHPSHFWRAGKPFVFGPLGGGETSPRRLRRELAPRDQAKEWFRDICNKLVLARPGLRATYRNSSLVIARTEETRAAIPAAARARCPVQEEIGSYSFEGLTGKIREGDRPLKALFAGRLLWWKGIDLAIRAVAAARELGGAPTLTIIGDGPSQRSLQALTADLGLLDSVTFEKRLNQDRLFQRYQE